MYRYLLAAFLCLGVTGTAHAQACEPGPETDCDGDGYTPTQGDCDDLEPRANPGMREICYDGIDNNCDGFVDEHCDLGALEGSLQGGGGCTSENAIGGLFLLPLLALGLRPRRERTR